MSSHSVLSPSAAERWGNCPGAPAACKHLPESRSSEDAARGTVKHALGEKVLKFGGEARLALGEIHEADGFTFTVDDDFVQQVQSYVDGIRRADTGFKHIEVRLDTSPVLGVPGQGGTADCVILDPSTKLIEVHDAKFGFHRVNAAGNWQGLIYGAAALEQYAQYDAWVGFKFVIHQPSINHYDEHTYTLDDVREFLDEIRPAAQRAWAMYEGTMPIELNPGSHCQWCPIRSTCKARADRVLNMFDAVDYEPATPQLSNDEIGAALLRLDDIERWCKDLRAEGYRRAMAGQKIAGYKLVLGRGGDRRFVDGAEQLLDMFVPNSVRLYGDPQLRSPAQLEKELGKKHYDALLKQFVTQDAGSLKLVVESDPKEEVKVSTLEFDVV